MMFERIIEWLRGLGEVIRGLAGAVSHAREHPSEPPPLDEPWYYQDDEYLSRVSKAEEAGKEQK